MAANPAPASARTVEDTVQRIVDDGAGHLHLIFDFDMTMTKHWSSHGLFHRSRKVKADFRQATELLFQKYYPIEVSTKMTNAEKVPHMVRWWTEAHDLIVSQQLSVDDIQEMVRDNPIEFRGGMHAALEYLSHANVPVVVFSAGIANVIEQVLRENRLFYPQLHVISNRMRVDESGRIVGFHDPILHVFNKNEFTGMMKWSRRSNPNHVHSFTTAGASDRERSPSPLPLELDPCHTDIDVSGKIPEEANPNAALPHQRVVLQRLNVILVGDSLGDTHMADGVNHDALLRIGLCNRVDVEEDGSLRLLDLAAEVGAEAILDDYLRHFDLVVCGDIGFSSWFQPLLEAIVEPRV